MNKKDNIYKMELDSIKEPLNEYLPPLDMINKMSSGLTFKSGTIVSYLLPIRLEYQGFYQEVITYGCR